MNLSKYYIIFYILVINSCNIQLQSKKLWKYEKLKLLINHAECTEESNQILR